MSNVRSTDLGDIWCGDVLRCWNALDAHGGDQRAQIAEILGFHMNLAPLSQRSVDSLSPEPTSTELSTAPTPTPSVVAPGVTRTVPMNARLSTETRQDQPPAWFLEPIALDEETKAHVGFEPSFDPLFDARWTRAIIGALCAVTARDGSIDVPGLVDRLARCQPLTQLPFKYRPTLRLGIQLLIDDGPGMMPFRRDARDLASRITEIVGAERTLRRSFRDHPVPQEGERRDARKQYQLPPRGTPVVVLSDFGLSRGAGLRGGATVSRWLQFATLLRSAGCAVVGVVPLPRARWPRQFAKVIGLVPWDRKTAIGEVRRIAIRGPLR